MKFVRWMESVEARRKAESLNQDLSKKCAFFNYDDAKFRKNNRILTVYDEIKTKRLLLNDCTEQWR